MRILQRARQSPEELRVAVWCRSGKHRSVGMASLLSEALTFAGLEVEQVHLCCWWWDYTRCAREGRRTGVCCRSCFGDVAAKRTFFEEVRATCWAALMQEG